MRRQKLGDQHMGTGKTPQMESFLDSLSQRMFGVSRQEDVCPFCKTEISGREDFKDDLSWTEHKISHLCQKCQDEVFGQRMA